jgi:DNA-binding response OmpR family regulator
MNSESNQKLRVFVVDEEHIFASTLAQFLRQEGHDARSFPGPLEALYAAITEPPDILISDVALLPLSGAQLATEMRAHNPRCKVLLFSSFPATNDLLQNTSTAEQDFTLLPGPVYLVNLMEAIQALVHDCPLSHQLPPNNHNEAGSS